MCQTPNYIIDFHVAGVPKIGYRTMIKKSCVDQLVFYKLWQVILVMGKAMKNDDNYN